MTATHARTQILTDIVRTSSNVPGMLKSMVSKSTENLEEMRPLGVLEKKEKGAPKGREMRKEEK